MTRPTPAQLQRIDDAAEVCRLAREACPSGSTTAPAATENSQNSSSTQQAMPDQAMEGEAAMLATGGMLAAEIASAKGTDKEADARAELTSLHVATSRARLARVYPQGTAAVAPPEDRGGKPAAAGQAPAHQGCKPVELYGGAMTSQAPARFVDVATFRKHPRGPVAVLPRPVAKRGSRRTEAREGAERAKTRKMRRRGARKDARMHVPCCWGPARASTDARQETCCRCAHSTGVVTSNRASPE